MPIGAESLPAKEQRRLAERLGRGQQLHSNLGGAHGILDCGTWNRIAACDT